MLENEKKPKSIAPIQSKDEIDAVKYGQNCFRPNNWNNQAQSGGNEYKIMVAINKLKTIKIGKINQQQQ